MYVHFEKDDISKKKYFGCKPEHKYISKHAKIANFMSFGENMKSPTKNNIIMNLKQGS